MTVCFVGARFANSVLCFSLYNHIQLSSNLISGCDYSLFKVHLIYLFKSTASEVVLLCDLETLLVNIGKKQS